MDYPAALPPSAERFERRSDGHQECSDPAHERSESPDWKSFWHLVMQAKEAAGVKRRDD